MKAIMDRCVLCGGLITEHFYITLSSGDMVCEMCIAQKMRERREKLGHTD